MNALIHQTFCRGLLMLTLAIPLSASFAYAEGNATTNVDLQETKKVSGQPDNSYKVTIESGKTNVKCHKVVDPRSKNKKYLTGKYKVTITHDDKSTEEKELEFDADGNADYGTISGLETVKDVDVTVPNP
jgi:hypothetical protein